MDARRVCGDVGVLEGGGGTEKEVVAERGMLTGGPVRVLTCCSEKKTECPAFGCCCCCFFHSVANAVSSTQRAPHGGYAGVIKKPAQAACSEPQANAVHTYYFSNSSWRIHAVQSSVSSSVRRLVNSGFAILVDAVFLRVSRGCCVRWWWWWCFDSRGQWPIGRRHTAGCKAQCIGRVDMRMSADGGGTGAVK